MSRRQQQAARVNVDDATWQAFRIRAIQANRSVADELCRLVRHDLRHSLPPEPSKPSTDEPSRTGAREPLDAEPTRRPTPTVRHSRAKQRLADLDLLTELPYRDQPRPGGSRSA
jgi:plasmid stability protein